MWKVIGQLVASIAATVFLMKMTITHIPHEDLLSIFSTALKQISRNYFVYLLPSVLFFLPFLLSLITVKKSEKRFLEFYAVGLLTLATVFPEQKNPSQTNLVMNEPLIVKGENLI